MRLLSKNRLKAPISARLRLTKAHLAESSRTNPICILLLRRGISFISQGRLGKTAGLPRTEPILRWRSQIYCPEKKQKPRGRQH